MFVKILVPLDASNVDTLVKEPVRALAKAFGSEVIVLRVAHYHTRDGRAHEVSEAEDCAAQFAAELAAEGVCTRSVIGHGEVVETIIRAAEQEQADLIVMAGHGHSHVAGWLLGSTIEDVRHRCDVPLLLMKGTR